MSSRQWAQLLALGGIWGSSFLFIELVLRELSPVSLVFLRLALAAPLLWIVVAWNRIRPPSGARLWAVLAAMALINNVAPFLLITWAQQHIASGQASILNATTPVFTALLAAMAIKNEPLTAHKLAGTFMGLLGVAVLVGHEAVLGLGGQLLAELAVIGAALCYGVGNVLGRKALGSALHPLAAAAGQVALAAAMLAPVAIVTGGWHTAPWPGPPTWMALITLAVAGTALAYALYFRLLASAGATNVSVVTLLVPCVAVLLGAVFLRESVTPVQLLGFAAIAVGLLVIDGRILRRHQ